MRAHCPRCSRLLRAVWPILRVGKHRRRDALRRRARGVRQRSRLRGAVQAASSTSSWAAQPFFLGMADTPAVSRRHGGDAAGSCDLTTSPGGSRPRWRRLAEAIVAEAGGKLEVVDALVRRVTFDVLGEYFGVPDPPDGDLRVWATRLFEFQFADQATTALRARGRRDRAGAARPHPDRDRAAARLPACAKDDVLGRCLEMQAEGEPGFTDDQIRTALMGFIVGGPPQPPMVVPQALEQLLRRPDALAGAQAAARTERRRVARRLCARSDALRSARPGLAAGGAGGLRRSPPGPRGARKVPPRRNGPRRLQLGDDGRAPGAGAAPVRPAPPAARIHAFRLRPAPRASASTSTKRCCR